VIADPRTAPPRYDLTFLRHRSKPRPAPELPQTAAVTDFVTGHAVRPPHHGAQHPPTPTTTAPAAPISGSLDLSSPAAPSAPRVPTAPPSTSGSLDLSASPAPTPPPPRQPQAPKAQVRRDRRVRAGDQQLLSVKEPTVTLTRVQSGIGQLEIEAICSPDVGDLRLGAAYQLRSGPTSTVQLAGGNRFAPSSRRPVIVAGRDEYEHLRFDLRQVQDLERVAVYAYSESRADLSWGGTLVITTFGGARIELSLETLFAGKVAVLASIYNLDGELVIRAEMETITGDVREAARAYGYDRITWRDDRSPVD
jgi:uncharacterized protein involved in tellurium resistance